MHDEKQCALTYKEQCITENELQCAMEYETKCHQVKEQKCAQVQVGLLTFFCEGKIQRLAEED